MASLGHPYKFRRVLRLGSVTARHLVVGVSQTAAFNKGRHLYSAGRPSGWALAHISSSIFFFFFFPRLISAAAHWMCTILRHVVWPSANLECRSETYCARLAVNAGPKKSLKIGHLGTIAQLCRAISSLLRHVSTMGKIVKQQYLLYMSPTIW